MHDDGNATLVGIFLSDAIYLLRAEAHMHGAITRPQEDLRVADLVLA